MTEKASKNIACFMEWRVRILGSSKANLAEQQDTGQELVICSRQDQVNVTVSTVAMILVGKSTLYFLCHRQWRPGRRLTV